ncbi:MAG: DUF4962 domain-containing protein, partial [Gammaproteobacteria bacterium]
MKHHLLAATVLMACSLCTSASEMFTEVPLTYSSTEQAAIMSQLSPTAVASAIQTFDNRTTPMGHPRMLKGQADYAGIVAATKAERSIAVQAAGGYLKRHPVADISTTLTSQINSTDSTVRMSSWWEQNRILEGMAEAATVYFFTQDSWYLNEMRARMNVFGPAVLKRGCSGDVNETRDYAWFFALAYDMAYAGMTDTDRKMAKDIVLACGNYNLLKTPDTVRQYPENGIAFNGLGKFVGALLIMRGDLPEANTWLNATLPTYIDALSPWGGVDGGFSNGSSYAEWDAGESLLFWDLIERVLDLPLYKKSWVTELPRFLTYILPPGTPAGAFGDGAEVTRTEDWARFGKAIMNRSSTALSHWYVK